LICQFSFGTICGMGKQRGRPPKNPEQARELSLDVRLDPSEKAAFQEAAELSGVSLSAWVRERLRQVARTELEGAGRQVPFLANPRKDPS
jgi:predicted HicB family RNase H-like nuclease